MNFKNFYGIPKSYNQENELNELEYFSSLAIKKSELKSNPPS